MLRRIPFQIAAVLWCVSIAATQADDPQPTLIHAGYQRGFARFILTNPTQERLFLVMSCTRVVKGPLTIKGVVNLNLPCTWRVAQKRSEGLVVPLEPASSLHLLCGEPPGNEKWRVIAYLLRHGEDHQSAFTPAVEVERPKYERREHTPRAFPVASNKSLEPTAARFVNLHVTASTLKLVAKLTPVSG